MILPKAKKYVSNYVVILGLISLSNSLGQATFNQIINKKKSNHCEERFENLWTKTLQDKTEHKTVHRAISPNDNSYVACKVAKRLFFVNRMSRQEKRGPYFAFVYAFVW